VWKVRSGDTFIIIVIKKIYSPSYAGTLFSLSHGGNFREREKILYMFIWGTYFYKT
jgi:hypothetical protein